MPLLLTELSIEERAAIQVGLAQKLSLRAIARMLERPPSTISREVKRNSSTGASYQARNAQLIRNHRRISCRLKKKLKLGSDLFDLVIYLLRQKFSPQQIAGRLRTMKLLGYEDTYVCRETIYNAIYALPVGELKKELIICLRQGKSTRKPHAGGVDRRGQIPEMVSIHMRPPEIESRVMPGHWEGDLIKGKMNASAVGTLVERTSGYLILARMRDATSDFSG